MSGKYDDPKVWAVFAKGLTKGLFQLESNLGKSWSKKLAPENIEHLSALMAILRPGCSKVIVDGKSMTQHYVDRKNGKDEVKYPHPALEDILKPTYGVLVYQEQSMRIAQKLAGFNLEEADVLRKAIGKKDADLMNKVKVKFIEGAKVVGVLNENDAEMIFGWIQKSSRYAFNKSHSVSYAISSYQTAKYKSYHPIDFFVSTLTYAGDHQEIYELVSEAKLFDIDIKLPCLSTYFERFEAIDNTIYFGLKDVKSLVNKAGDTLVQGIKEVEQELSKKINDCSWLEILLYLSTKINSTAFRAIASIGFFRDCKDRITRNQALYEYDIFKIVNKNEAAWLVANYRQYGWKTLKDALTSLAPTKKQGGGTNTVARQQVIENEIQLLTNPPYDLKDDPNWIVDQEVKFLGCPVSLARVESSDTSAANTTCKEILGGKRGKNLCVVANIQRLSDYKITKKSKNQGRIMSFLTIEDETCSLDSVVVFPDVREEFKYILYEGNNLVLCGHVDEGDESFVVDSLHAA